MADLKEKLNEATCKYNDLGILVDALRCGTDRISTMLLARLRLGSSVNDLVESIRIDTVLTSSIAVRPEVVIPQDTDGSHRYS